MVSPSKHIRRDAACRVSRGTAARRRGIEMRQAASLPLDSSSPLSNTLSRTTNRPRLIQLASEQVNARLQHIADGKHPEHPAVVVNNRQVPVVTLDHSSKRL